MLEDRDYMREPDFRSGSMSMTKLLTIIFVVVFALQCIDDVYLHSNAYPWLALTSDGIRHGWVWQLLTFQFLHGSLGHIVGNLITFWWLGRVTEDILGRNRFLIALFGSGVVGGILQGVLMLLFPTHFGYMAVGASAGVSGLLAIFALIHKDDEIRFFGIFPLKGITLLWIWGGLSLFFTLVPSAFGGGIAYAAHLGGILAGMAWVKLGWHHAYNQLPWEGLSERFKSTGKKRDAGRTDSRRPKLVVHPDDGEAVKGDVDRILDKISAQGINSLSAREREILESARKKMSQQ